MCKYLIKFCFCLILMCFASCVRSKEITFVSLTPAITEIIYKLGAEDKLLGVSTTCNYPPEASSKDKLGDTYFINKERIIKLKPDYLFTLDTSEFFVNEFHQTSIKPVFFTFNTIEDIYKNIKIIGELIDREIEAQILIDNIKNKIANVTTKKPKKILYIIQSDPMLTIGNRSFISDVIKKSGHISVTQKLNSYYPIISEEYAMKAEPDIIIVSFYTNINKLKQLFPKAKIITLTASQKDIINRPGPRVYEGIKFFADL